jgi:hypothetical protein
MTQICVVGSARGAIAVAAAIDTGLLAAPAAGERIVLVTNNAQAPELVVPWHLTAAGQAVLTRFDRAIDLNADLHPYHPRAWSLSNDDLSLAEKLLRSHWSLGSGAIELVLDAVEEAPSATVARVFRGGPVTVFSDSLAGYGPTPARLLQHVSQLLQGLIYSDVLPGLKPVLMREYSVDLHPVPVSALKNVVGEMAASAASGPEPLPDYGDKPTALLLGQHISAMEPFTAEDEARLHVEMVAAAAEHGASRVAFMPYDSATLVLTGLVKEKAESLGLELSVLDGSVPAEVVAHAGRLDSVVSCFDSGLVTLEALYEVPALSVGAEKLLPRLRPFWDSSRMPLTIVDALTRPEDMYRDTAQLQRLVETVAYCMRDRAVPELRGVAEGLLGEMSFAERSRYATNNRLVALGLPPAEPPGALGLQGGLGRGAASGVRALLRKGKRRP